MAQLNLTVIRSVDIHSAVKFYQLLGLTFELHSHGNGPKHYATTSQGPIFEIYPASDNFPITKNTRIGFCVDSCGTIVQKLSEAGYEIKLQPTTSPWGQRAVAVDSDGHSIELLSSE